MVTETVIEERALTIQEQATALQVIDQQSADRAGELKLAISDLRREAELHHRPVIDAAYLAHKAALAALRRIDAPLQQAETRISHSLSRWIQFEMARRAEEERKQREEAERRRAEEIERELEQLESEGVSGEDITAIIDEVQAAPIAATPPAERVVVQGISTRITYTARVTDMKALLRYVLANPTMIGLIEPNETALNQLARMNKGAISIPGIAIEQQTGVARRGR